MYSHATRQGAAQAADPAMRASPGRDTALPHQMASGPAPQRRRNGVAPATKARPQRPPQSLMRGQTTPPSEESVGLNQLRRGDATKKRGCPLIARAERVYITPKGPTATEKRLSKPRHGEAGTRKFAVTRAAFATRDGRPRLM